MDAVTSLSCSLYVRRVITTYQQEFVDALRRSIRLQNPDVEKDKAYKYTDDDLWEILELVTPIHDAEYTVLTVPNNERFLVLLLAKRELFYRLATATAPLYPLEAEGASLRKDVRFDHYIKLIKLVEDSYNASYAGFFGTGETGNLQAFDVTIEGRYNTLRNYNMANRPVIALTLSTITATTVNLDWTKFSVKRGFFYCYKVFIDTEPLFDEYVEEPFLQSGLSAKFMSFDINKMKFRVTDLEPETPYYIAVLAFDRNGLYGYDQQQFTTLPVS